MEGRKQRVEEETGKEIKLYLTRWAAAVVVKMESGMHNNETPAAVVAVEKHHVGPVKKPQTVTFLFLEKFHKSRRISSHRGILWHISISGGMQGRNVK